MSLDEEKRALVVSMEMQKSLSTLKEVDICIENNMWSTAANRLYYALFHAVNALLIRDGHRIKSHKGAYTQFCLHYISSGILPKEYGNLYRQLEVLREESDYNCFYDVSSEELENRLVPAKEMIDAIAAMVK